MATEQELLARIAELEARTVEGRNAAADRAKFRAAFDAAKLPGITDEQMITVLHRLAMDRILWSAVCKAVQLAQAADKPIYADMTADEPKG